jgi:hypothetical protein
MASIRPQFRKHTAKSWLVESDLPQILHVDRRSWHLNLFSGLSDWTCVVIVVEAFPPQHARSYHHHGERPRHSLCGGKCPTILVWLVGVIYPLILSFVPRQCPRRARRCLALSSGCYNALAFGFRIEDIFESLCGVSRCAPSGFFVYLPSDSQDTCRTIFAKPTATCTCMRPSTWLWAVRIPLWKNEWNSCRRRQVGSYSIVYLLPRLIYSIT